MSKRSLTNWLSRFVSSSSSVTRAPKKRPRLELQTLEDRTVPTAGYKPPTPIPVCLDLGAAQDFNAFVFHDFKAQWTETEGRLAIGGSANLQGYGVGDRLQNSNRQRDDLIVGGNLNYTYGQTFAGNIVTGGSANLTGVGTPNGTVRKGNPINFSAAESDLKAKSNLYASQSTNGTITKQWGSINLTGTNATQNVFNLTAADFQNCWGLWVNVPKGSTVLINVSGSAVTMQYFGIQLNGVDASKVLFNFNQAKNVTFNGIGVEGSVLAPNAAVNFNNGNIRGNLIASSFCGTGELRYVPPMICIDVPKVKAVLSGEVCQEPYCPPGYSGPSANVTVIVTGTDYLGTVNRTTKTNAQGKFSFDDLNPGTYTLSIVLPNGAVQGSAKVGTKGGVVLNPTTITGIHLGEGDKGSGYKVKFYA